MARDGDRHRYSGFERDLAEVEATLRVLVEAELEAQHALDPHTPRVDECPTCRRLASCRGTMKGV